MRILWVKPGGLWPPTAGSRLRSFHILAELSRRQRVTVLTTHGPDEEGEALSRHLPECEVVSYPYAAPKQGSAGFVRALARSWLSPLPVDLWRWQVPELRAAVAARLAAGGVDICLADFLVSVPNLPREPAAPVVLFEHNVEHMIWLRLARLERSGWRRPALELEWRKMRRVEAAACARARLTLAVSEADRAALAGLAPGARVLSVPTGVDTTYFYPNGTPESAARLVFTGAMDWYPNEDAMLHFIRDVFPLLRAALPQVSLAVVGRNPSARLKAAGGDGVHVVGRVEDVRPYVAEAAVFVVPLRAGGGTRLKIFEALAMGKAVVSTTVGAEGLPLTPGQHLLLADDPQRFANAVLSLLRDPGQRGALGAAGRRLVEERFSWPMVAEAFEARLADALA